MICIQKSLNLVIHLIDLFLFLKLHKKVTGFYKLYSSKNENVLKSPLNPCPHCTCNRETFIHYTFFPNS